MASGAYPTRDNQGLPFPEDEHRAQLAGKKMAAKGVIVQLRSDWQEMVTRFGFFAWNHTLHPCFMCTARQTQLFEQMGQPTWEDKTWESFCQSCRACEIHLSDLSGADWKILTQILKEDNRKNGNEGMCLISDFPKLGLKKGDRLEPGQEMQDWSSFMSANPGQATFWRPHSGAVKHRCALFDKAIGTDLPSCMAIDAMHTLCLGVFQQWVVHAIWAILDVNLQGSTASDQESRDVANIKALRTQLFKWYPAAEKQLASKGHSLTRVSDINVKAIGSRSAPVLHFKAAESLGLLRWLGAFFEDHSILDRIHRGVEWGRGTACLLKMWDLVQEAPMVVPDAVQQDWVLKLGCSLVLAKPLYFCDSLGFNPCKPPKKI